MLTRYVDNGVRTNILTLTAEQESAVLVERLENSKLKKKRELQDSYESAMQAGFKSSALGTPHLYSSDQVSQTRLVGAVSAGVDGPYECIEVSSGNSVFPVHTILQLRQVLSDGAVLARNYKLNLRNKLSQSQSATTIDQIALIVW